MFTVCLFALFATACEPVPVDDAMYGDTGAEAKMISGPTYTVYTSTQDPYCDDLADEIRLLSAWVNELKGAKAECKQTYNDAICGAAFDHLIEEAEDDLQDARNEYRDRGC